MADDKMVVVTTAEDLRSLLGSKAAESPEKPEKPDEVAPIEHVLATEDGPLKYTSQVLDLPVDLEGKHAGTLTVIAYVAEGFEAGERPITFCFNGGPGSSSVWLHMGVFGPRRVVLDVDNVPTPPYSSEDNPLSLLRHSDLVFIDPMSTGFSRPGKGEGREYHSVESDIASVGAAIFALVRKLGRWGSPKYLAGESYGTTRATGLATHLFERYGMALNGLVLLSVALQFQTLMFHGGNDLPYVMALPVYAATAWFHGKIEGTTLNNHLARAEAFAYDVYAPALLRGDRVPPEQRTELYAQMAELTGLSPEFVGRCNGRVSLARFCRELLREQRLTVGRLDTRFTGREQDAAGEAITADPSMHALLGAYAAGLHTELVRLGVDRDEVYELLNMKVWPWKFEECENRYLDLGPRLVKALNHNPSLRVFVASGLYDLATPYTAADYTLANLGLEASARKRVVVETYEAGHMMYIHQPSLERLMGHLSAFYAPS